VHQMLRFGRRELRYGLVNQDARPSGLPISTLAVYGVLHAPTT
jgi:hypothetical protein